MRTLLTLAVIGVVSGALVTLVTLSPQERAELDAAWAAGPVGVVEWTGSTAASKARSVVSAATELVSRTGQDRADRVRAHVTADASGAGLPMAVRAEPAALLPGVTAPATA